MNYLLKIIFIIILFIILFNNINLNVKEYFTLDDTNGNSNNNDNDDIKFTPDNETQMNIDIGEYTCDPIVSEIYPESKQCPYGYRCPSQNEANCS